MNEQAGAAEMADQETGAADAVAGAADIRIVRGNPSAEETAAVVAVLSALRAAGAAAPATLPVAPAWTAAARLEGVGARLVASPADLTAP